MSNEEDLKEFIEAISETSDVERVARAHYISSSMLRVKSLREEAALLESQMISEEVMEFFLTGFSIGFISTCLWIDYLQRKNDLYNPYREDQ